MSVSYLHQQNIQNFISSKNCTKFHNNRTKFNAPDNFGAVLFVIVKGDNGDGARRG